MGHEIYDIGITALHELIYSRGLRNDTHKPYDVGDYILVVGTMSFGASAIEVIYIDRVSSKPDTFYHYEDGFVSDYLNEDDILIEPYAYTHEIWHVVDDYIFPEDMHVEPIGMFRARRLFDGINFHSGELILYMHWNFDGDRYYDCFSAGRYDLVEHLSPQHMIGYMLRNRITYIDYGIYKYDLFYILGCDEDIKLHVNLTLKDFETGDYSIILQAAILDHVVGHIRNRQHKVAERYYNA